MQEKIRKFIEEFHMIEEGDTVLAAVSGGADSLCLLLLLHDLCAEMKFGLCVVHVEHGIRGEESLKDAVFVEKICGEMHIPCKVCRCRALEYAGQHKLTVEEAARKLRYQLFDETATEFGANKIAVAHNQNDCAETMLFHLARGSGLLGLCGIRPVRGQIIRPGTYSACANQYKCRYAYEPGGSICGGGGRADGGIKPAGSRKIHL